MTPEEFIRNVSDAIDHLVELYAQGADGPTYLGMRLDALEIPEEQRAQVLELLTMAVGEATHSLICGLEGSCALGQSQHSYTLLDHDGNELTGALGELHYKCLERGR